MNRNILTFSNKMHLLSISDLSKQELNELIFETRRIKNNPEIYRDRLSDKSIVLIFEKPSTRTKVSFEAAMFQLGGYPITLSRDMSQLSRGETPGDSARVLSRYINAIVARVYRHETLVEMAKNSSVPVINALSDLEHPCQVISDLYTIYELKGKFKGVKLAYVGDGNNVCNSLLLGCAMVGIDISIATPLGYEPKSEIVSKAEEISNSEIKLFTLPTDAVKDADFVYTDVWVGMGNESERNERMKAFKNYQVNNELLKFAKRNCKVMHCLPANRGLEITDDMMDGNMSIIWDQAENRLHAQKAILLKLIK